MRTWFGVNGSRQSGSDIFSTLSGREFTIFSVSTKNVRSDSSSSCCPDCNNSVSITARTVLIWRSQQPPMWLAEGTLKLKFTQSQFSLSRKSLTLSRFISFSSGEKTTDADGDRNDRQNEKTAMLTNLLRRSLFMSQALREGNASESTSKPLARKSLWTRRRGALFAIAWIKL